MGFKDPETAVLAGLFGEALYDVIYPKWWGGQGKSSEVPVTGKVNEVSFLPGANGAEFVPHATWDRSVSREPK